MTTLETLQALTDEQLIERIAVEAMGWEPQTDEWEKIVWKNWKPLTDWNHTMEVVEKVREREPFNMTLYRKADCCDILGQHYELPSVQRAICIAALLAVSSPSSK